MEKLCIEIPISKELTDRFFALTPEEQQIVLDELKKATIELWLKEMER